MFDLSSRRVVNGVPQLKMTAFECFKVAKYGQPESAPWFNVVDGFTKDIKKASDALMELSVAGARHSAHLCMVTNRTVETQLRSFIRATSKQEVIGGTHPAVGIAGIAQRFSQEHGNLQESVDVGAGL